MEKPVAPLAPVTCGPENVDAFRYALHGAIGDEGMALVKALYKAGMLDGQRGVRVGPLGGLQRAGEAGVCPVLSDAAEKRVADLWWKRAQDVASK